MFGKSYELFRLFGFPIRIDLSWLIIVVLITWSLAAGVFPAMYKGLPEGVYWLMGVIGALGLFVSIILHELSHSLVARHYDMPMRGITLFIFGGVAEMGDEPQRPGVEFLMAIAGPIASVVIALVCWGLRLVGLALNWPPIVVGVVGYLALINALLVVFNILPAFPLDGGRVLRSALWKWKGNLRWATSVTSQIGSGFGVALIILGVITIISGAFVGGMWWVLIGLFLRAAARQSYQQLLVRRALEGEPVSRFMHPDVTTAPPDMTIATLVDDYVYQHHFKLFPVTRDGKLVGCVTTEDIKNTPRDRWNEMLVADIAQPCTDQNTVNASDDAVRALSKMNRDGRSRLMVVDHGDLVGVLTLKDLLKFISLKVELEEKGNGSGTMHHGSTPTAALHN